MSVPKVSVILPAYNAEPYLEEAITSILNQSFTDFELFIINDGSTDGTKQIIQRMLLLDDRINYVENEQNKGLIYTLNRGLSLAKGKYIARMDADDIALPNRFQVQVDFLDKREDIIVVGGNVEVFGHEKSVSNFLTESDEIKFNLFFENTLSHPLVMFRNEVIKKHDLSYDSKFLHLEDWGLWIKMAKYGGFKNLKDVLLRYRIEGQNISIKNADTFEARSKTLFKAFIGELYGVEVNDELVDDHWRVAVCFYEKEEAHAKIIARLKRLEKLIQQKGSYDKVHVSRFFKKQQMLYFYKITDTNSWKGLKFAMKAKILNFQAIKYAFGMLLK